MKNFRTVFALLFSLIILITSCEKSDNTTEPETNKWSFELVDSIPGSDVGVINRTAYDSQGGLHMAYTVTPGTSLRYAYKPLNGVWTSTEICPKLFYAEIDMAIDTLGVVYIAFEPDTDESIHLAIKNQDGTFDDILVDVLDTHNHQGRFPALFADNNGKIHITLDRANYGLRYTSYVPGTGFTAAETIDDIYSGSVADLVVDHTGRISIVYQSGSDILYAHKVANSDVWHVNSIYNTGEGSQSYEGINLVMDHLENLHGVFRKGQSDNNVIYMVLGYGNTNWDFETLQINNGSNRTDRAIACDIHNVPHVLYDQDFGLYMGSYDLNWVYNHIVGDADSRCDSNYDIQIDDSNRAHVSFHNRTTKVLYYAKKMME